MKKKLLFLVSLISTSMVLTACGGLGGDGEGSGGGNGITLPNTAEQAVNMFYQFASNTGLEITYRVYDDESAQPETNTIGFKNDVFWVKESVAYKKVGTTLESYEYDASKRSYEFQAAVAESGQYSLDYFLKSLTSAFYAGYDYASGSVSAAITAKKDVTFLTRAATEYTFSASAGSATATLNIVFDNATGITLKIYGSATGGGDNSSAEYEVTSFAVGDAVTIPTLNKPSGQGGEGQGGEGQGGEGGGGQTDVDVFSNKLLMYVSNQSANVYANSQLGLFADGKFELSFMQNGYQVVIFGNYTVASNKTTATLVTTQVYKDQGKQTSPMNETWVLNFANNAYALKVSNNGTVNYNAAGGQPSHYVIPGEGGETGDVENFVNHMFTYVSQQNAAEFVNSTIALFDDATFEVVTTQNGSLKVYLGNYTVNTSDTAATLSVTKYYSAASGQYVTQAVGNWLLTLQQNNYMLSMAGGPTVYYALSANAPVHADIPEEGTQTGDDAKYKVSETQWTAMVYSCNYLTLTSNFSLEATSSNANEGQMKLAFDNGKVRDEGSYYGVTYYSFTSNEEGTYYYQADGNWVAVASPMTFDTFNGYLGLLPVPFDKVSFNSITKCYGAREWKDESNDMTYWNYRVYFEDGKIMKITYEAPSWTGAGRTTYEFVLYGYGQAKVTLPEVSGGGTDANARYKVTADLWEDMIIDGGLVDLDSNFTAMVTTSDNQRGYTKYEFDEGKICVYTVDADGTTSEDYFEYENAQSGYMYSIGLAGVWTRETYRYGIGSFFNSLGVLKIEFSNLTFNETTHEYDLRSWTNGSGNLFTNIHFSFDNNKLLKMRYADQYTSREVEFSKYDSTSVTLPKVGGGGQQQTSKWPAEDIAAKLGQFDFNVTIPNPTSFESIEEENLVSVTDTIPMDYSGVSIVITLDDATNARIVASNYIRGISGFTMDTNDSDFENNKFVLYNTAKDTVITINFSENSSVVSLFVAKYKKPSNGYEEAVEVIKRVIGEESVVPNILMDDATYSTSNYGTLFVRIAFPEGTDMEEALANLIDNISEQGFHYTPRFLGYVLPEKGDRSTVVTPRVYSATELSVKVAREDTSLTGYGITTLAESDNGNPPYINWFSSYGNEDESGYEYRAHYSTGENRDQITLHEGEYFFVYDFENEQHFYAAIDDRSLNGEFELYLEYDEEMGGFLVLQDFTAYFYFHIEMDNDKIYIKDINEPLSQWEQACEDALEYNSDYVIPDLEIDGATGYVWNGGNESIDVTLAEDTSMTDVIDSLNAKLSDAGFHYSVRYGVFVKVDANATVGFSINEDNSISIYPGTADFADDDGGYGLIILAYDEAGDYYYNDGEDIGYINPSNENEYIVTYYFEEGTHFVIYDFSNETQFDVSINEASFGGNYEDYIEYDMDSNSFVVKQSFEADVYIQLSWGNDTIYIQLIVNE